jgi:hypothetical protein
MRALLDINVLVALLDADHIHHAVAMDWLGRHIGAGWASCPLTQVGCLRVLSQPGYPNPVPPAVVAERLAEATATAHHAFWPDDISLLGLARWDAVLRSRQVSDAHLLALAVRNGGRFVSFERSVPLHAVPGAEARHVVVI